MQLSFLSTGVSALLIVSANAASSLLTDENLGRPTGKRNRRNPPSDIWLTYSINWDLIHPGQVMFSKIPAEGKFKFWQLVSPESDTRAVVKNPYDDTKTILTDRPIGDPENHPKQLFVFDTDPSLNFNDAVADACIEMFRKDAADFYRKWFPKDLVIKVIRDHNESHPDFVKHLSKRLKSVKKKSTTLRGTDLAIQHIQTLLKQLNEEKRIKDRNEQIRKEQGAHKQRVRAEKAAALRRLRDSIDLCEKRQSATPFRAMWKGGCIKVHSIEDVGIGATKRIAFTTDKRPRKTTVQLLDPRELKPFAETSGARRTDSDRAQGESRD